MQRVIAIIASTIIFSSCSNKSQTDVAVLKAAQEGFEQSNKTISHSTEIIYRALQEKLVRPETAQQASVWQPKATVINERTKSIIKYIDGLIKKLQDNEKANAVNNLFFNEKKGDELFNKLQTYKQDILNIDAEISREFEQNAIIITQAFEADTNKTKDFNKTFFYQQSPVSALAILRKFENNVRVLENECVSYCFNKIGMVDGPGFFTKTSVMVSQSANMVKAGDIITIKAGVGEFSVASNPAININGIAIPVDDAVATYKFKTPLKAGKYYLPVKIDYTDPNGLKQTKTEKVEYTVVE
jgi:hypothetical protein